MKLFKLAILLVWLVACGGDGEHDNGGVPPWSGPIPLPDGGLLGTAEQALQTGSFGGTVFGSRADGQICTLDQASGVTCRFLNAAQNEAFRHPLYKIGFGNTVGPTPKAALRLAMGALAGEINALADADAFVIDTVPCTTCNILVRHANIASPAIPTSNAIKDYGKLTWGGCRTTTRFPGDTDSVRKGTFLVCDQVTIDIDTNDVIARALNLSTNERFRNVLVNRALAGIGIGHTSGTGPNVGFRHQNFLSSPQPFNALDAASTCMLNAYFADGSDILTQAPC